MPLSHAIYKETLDQLENLTVWCSPIALKNIIVENPYNCVPMQLHHHNLATNINVIAVERKLKYYHKGVGAQNCNITQTCNNKVCITQNSI